jgi:hypothetical protein
MFQTICSTLTELCYVQEKLGYTAFLILLECCTINICAADNTQKVISLLPKGYTSAEWAFHVAQILLHSHSYNLPQQR